MGQKYLAWTNILENIVICTLPPQTYPWIQQSLKSKIGPVLTFAYKNGNIPLPLNKINDL